MCLSGWLFCEYCLNGGADNIIILLRHLTVLPGFINFSEIEVELNVISNVVYSFNLR